MSPMKILVIHQQFVGPGMSGGSRMNELTRHWVRQGHEVTVVAGTVAYDTGKTPPAYRGKFFVREEVEGVRVLRTYLIGGYHASFLRRLLSLLSFMVTSFLGGLRVGRHEVVIATSPPLFVGISGWLLACCWRCPFVFEVRDLWPQSAVDLGLLRNLLAIRLSEWLEQFIYRRADRICILLPYFRSVIERKGISAEKVLYIPNAADLELFAQARPRQQTRRALGFDSDFLVLYLGAHGTANHLLQVLEAARRLAPFPEIHLLLVGDGMQKPWLKQVAREWNLAHVHFLDPVPKTQVPDLCRAVDAGLVVLKKVETFKHAYPNKLFDYLAAGLPVVCGLDGTARELVERAGAGLYAEPENPDAIANAILYLYRHPEERARMGANGRRFVEQEFRRDKLADDYIGHLHALVQQKLGAISRPKILARWGGHGFSRAEKAAKDTGL